MSLAAGLFCLHAYALEKKIEWTFVQNENAKIFLQGHRQNSCGYGALLNNLSFGSDEVKKVLDTIEGKTDDDKLSNLANRFDSKKSVQYPDGGRMRDNGISALDLLQDSHELREGKVSSLLSGECLVRKADESRAEMGERIHRLLLNSVSKNEPPILLIRSETAHFKPRRYQSAVALIGMKNVYKKSSRWDAEKGHFITVIGVPNKVNEDGSFCVDYIDSAIGKRRQLFVYPENRGFLAPVGVDKNTKWLDDFPYLVVASPSLGLDTEKEKWNERTILFLDYALCGK